MRVLSVDGGGYLGLASASFIEESERHFKVRFHDRFDLFCGTSTGAIIALALAAGMTGTDLCKLYERFGKSVFRNGYPGVRWVRFAFGLVASMYGNYELKKALDDVFQDRTLGDLAKAKKYVAIPAFCVSNGKPRIFKTDHSPNLSAHNSYRLADVALASAAAPFYLPLVKIKSPMSGEFETFCDGGVFANHPALIGYTEALHELKCKPKSISILSISTPRDDLAEPDSGQWWWRRKILARGLIIWRDKLISLLIDSNSAISNQLMLRIAQQTDTLFERIDMTKPKGLAMDLATKETTATLKLLGFDSACQIPMRQKLAKFLQDKEIINGEYSEAV